MKNEDVIKKIPDDVKLEIMADRVLREQGDDPKKLNIKDIRIQQNQLKNQVSKLMKVARIFKFENNAFIMLLPGGTQGAIDFTDVRGKTDILTIFEIFFYYWQIFGKLVDGWVKVDVPKDVIRKALSIKGRNDVTDDWIKDTISNIRRFKIQNSKLKDFISIDYYDRKNKVYPFRIKQIWL